ncbi:hypothetical protein C0992_006473 [Termitomyces sp. T32_za158]|nr:hypothetical protein C0992_006473 [Termitomyces sp. T32_za158]
MYSSTMTTQASSRQGGYTKGYAPQVPQGFTVRVLKDPSVYSLPQTTPSHFDRGYQAIPVSEPRQNNNNLNWYTRSQTQTTTLASSESQKTSQPLTSSGNSLPNDPRIFACDPSSRSKSSSYSIYQSTNDTFIYEASLSSNADLSSNSEDGDSAFSPAMSTDSITTVRGANTPDASLADLRTSTPAPVPTSSSSRTYFPLNIPSLMQAQTAIKGIFRSQAQNDSQSATDTSFSISSGTLAKPSVSKPIRVAETASRSGDRDSGITKHHDEHTLSGDAHIMRSRSSVPDDEDIEVDPIAKANAEYNAAASKAGLSVPYCSSARDPVHPSIANSTATGAGMRSATGPLHPNLTVRSGAEKYLTQATTPHSYWGAPEMTRPHNMANGHGSHFPSGDPLASAAQVPLSQSSGPSSRYVPASHTMTPRTSPERRSRGSVDHRTSPEHVYTYPSQQSIPQLSNCTTALPSGERASRYVNSASTRGTSTSPPRTRQDSTAVFTNGPSTRPSNIETGPALTPAQGRPQQDIRTRQISIYGPHNPRIDDARNPRGREHGSRLETGHAMADPYSRTSERQASHVSNAYPQRGPATTVSSSSSSSTRSRPEKPAVSDPSQIPFPTPAREPQRRGSDDTSAVSQPIYGPAYISTSGANVPAVTSTVPEASRTTEPQIQRHYSDDESNVPLTLFRTVRWNENLICPSPIFPHQRRKGWFNRRGDQLWTNEGAYKPPEQGQECPSDLDGYPEFGEGWMNEQGVRIDMAHRLIPKVPLKSALKTSRS